LFTLGCIARSLFRFVPAHGVCHVLVGESRGELGILGEHTSPSIDIGRSGRKERERRSSDGVFALGRSNAPPFPLQPF